MICTNGHWFRDESGRTVMLRGVNLGGSSKIPSQPDGATYQSEGFFDTRHVSFIGRPFPLEEADEHFTRLKTWGFNCLRFLVTWEAIEHAGPGIYDEEYLDYLYKIVKKAGDYDLNLFIDPHQDVWSRFSGGDGAPGWTFDLLGMDITKFKETGAAVVHQTYGDPFPHMIWSTNNFKYAAATLFTLFFAGNDFAPACKIDGVPVQDYLQEYYINAVKQVVLKLKGLPNVIGYDTLNEPFKGYIGLEDLTQRTGNLFLGEFPTPWQSFQLASGFPQPVDILKPGIFGARKIGKTTLNRRRSSLFREGHQCPWRQHGVWEKNSGGEPVLLKPDYFSNVKGREVNFNEDYLKPFLKRFTEMVRSVDKNAIVFIESVPISHAPKFKAGELVNTAYAVHWYDGVVITLKRYLPWLGYDYQTGRVIFGAAHIRRNIASTHTFLKQEAYGSMGNIPILIGEVGIPFDLNGGKAYRTGNFTAQEKALERSMHALDENLFSYMIWNYTPDNNNRHGDLWNAEDLSIFSRDQQSDPRDIHSGGRAVKVFVRPYPMKTAGEPTLIQFDPWSGHFVCEFTGDPGISAPSEFFLPAYHYGNGCRITVSDGRYEIDQEKQRLTYHSGSSQLHRIEIMR